MLLPFLMPNVVEVGCDEAGRGCLSGDVYAAAVVLPTDFQCDILNDSKQLTEKQRNELRFIIESEALAWAVGVTSIAEIDEINILNASILAMHRAIEKVEKQLKIKGLQAVQHIIVDGNRFKPYGEIKHQTVVKGDAKYLSIAAASVLAKTHRDEYMLRLHNEFPQYSWSKNKGYPTVQHREAIAKYGATSYHRMTFKLLPEQQFTLW